MAVLGFEPVNDPFSGQKYQPPQSVIWDEHPYFFEPGTVRDATLLLARVGISLRAGHDLAFFHQNDERLYVRASRENIELVAQFTDPLETNERSKHIEVGVVITGFTKPGVWEEWKTADDPQALMETLSAEEGEILARASLITRSGQPAFFGQTKSAAADLQIPLSDSQEPALATAANVNESDPGLRLRAEPVLGADGSLIDIGLKGSFCLPSAAAGPAPVSGSFDTAIRIRSGHCVMQRLSLENAKWKEAAMLFHARIGGIERLGWKDGQRVLLPREERWRALGVKRKAEER